MRAGAAALGRPETAFAPLLVAGTNGKGSVAAYLEAALRGPRGPIGRYTSPHLVRVHERIVVDGEEITESELAAVLDVIRGLPLPRPLTFFETVTLAAFEHFRRRQVVTAVLEVGMGGRLDATNVCEPRASAIVSIDRDHEAYLGSTLDAIAREKAGVMRPGVTTVLGRMRDEAHAALVEEAGRRGARVVDAWTGTTVSDDGGAVRVTTPARAYGPFRPLPGRHQIDNVLVALRTLETAHDAGVAVDWTAVAERLSRTVWPGRLEHVPGEPPLLLDGAHNPAAARVLADHLSKAGPFVLLFGVMADKDVESIAAALFPGARQVVVTQVESSRAATPAEVAARTRSLGVPLRLETDLDRALEAAREAARPDATVVVAGSLYLVGAVKARLGSGS